MSGRVSRFDVAVAAAVLLVAGVELSTNASIAPKTAAVPCELVLAAVLVWRRTLPLATFVVVAVVQVIEAVAGVPLQEPIVPLLASVIAVYALVTVDLPVSKVLVGGTIGLVAVAVETVIQHKGLGNFLFALVFLIGAAIGGRTVTHRTRQAAHLLARTEILERDQQAEAERAVAEERARIARELHDVIAHSVSVMVVQAGAAEQVIGRDEARATAAVRAVQQTGRDALTEMARLLGMLREGGEEIGLAPQPGLAEIPCLVDEARVSGLPVDFVVEGEPRSLAPGPELAVYRIVQEAITNIRKHADGVLTTIRLTYQHDGITAEIRNAPNGARGSGLPGGGHGLVGMRERVTVYGGTLRAGVDVDGGYTVTARLPIDPVA